MNANSALISSSRISAQRLAGRSTPFLTNCWYVAGFSAEFSREHLRSRTILGKPVVLYRRQDGAAVALDDRCPHRSFPLSRGRLDHGSIVCGYHGLRYGPNGRCLEVPGRPGEPRGIAVRSYPMCETGPLVWIWMGSEEPKPLPSGLDWISDGERWPSSRGYFHLPANYISLHENLLDLTHLTFLHASSFGTPDYALAPYTVSTDEEQGRFAIHRSVIPTKLPPVWAQPTGLTDRNAARVTRSEFHSPAIHIVTACFYDCDLTESDRQEFRIATAHLVTPETPQSTHYFIHHGRDFALTDPAVTQFMHQQLFAAFQEDVDGLTALERTVQSVPESEFYEFSLPSDRAGVAMRRWLYETVHKPAAAAG